MELIAVIDIYLLEGGGGGTWRHVIGYRFDL